MAGVRYVGRAQSGRGTLFRVAFAAQDGPSAHELAALRRACAYVADWPLDAARAALRGMDALVVSLEGASVADALQASGVRVEAIGEYTPAAVAAALGCAVLRPGEARWVVRPSFETEWVLTATPSAGAWRLEVRRSATSLWEARVPPARPEDVRPRPRGITVARADVPASALDALEARVDAAIRSTVPSACVLDGTSTDFFRCEADGTLTHVECRNHPTGPRAELARVGHLVALGILPRVG